MLIGEQEKNKRVKISQDMSDCANECDSFLNTITNGDRDMGLWLRFREMFGPILLFLCPKQKPC